MGYRHNEWIFKDSIEHEYFFNGNYGAKGEKRSPKTVRTPEEMRQINQKHKEKKVRRLIKQNFEAGDHFTTLTFSDQYIGIPLSEVCKLLSRFLEKMRRIYKKQDIPFKYIYRVELGARKKRPHVHILMNRIDNLDKLIREKWTYGHIQIEPITDNADTPGKLAEYITKPTKEQQIEADSLCDGDISKLVRYSCSRNLERPKPKTKVVRNRTMRSVFNSDLKPTPGYYIDKDPHTLTRGINPYTGRSYLTYQEIRLKPKIRPEPVRICECPICHQLKFDVLECDCQKKKRRRGKKHG